MRRFSLSAAQRPLATLLTANTISQIGNNMASLAIPWFVLTTTGSGSSTAITVAVGAFPVIISGIFGGAIIDRIGFKRASVISDVASGLSTLMIPILHATIGIAFWQLLVLVFLGAMLDAPGTAARRSMFPDLVANSGVPIDRANASYNVAGRVAAMVSAPIGGILIASLGATNLLFLNGLSFFVSAVIVLIAIPTVLLHKPESSSSGVRSYLNEVATGFRYVYQEKVVLWLVLGFSVGGLLAEPIYGLILPYYTQENYGSPVNLGYIFGALAVGSLFGNLIYVTLGRRLSRRVMVVDGFLVRGLAFVVFAFNPSWWVVAIAIFIGAVALEPINPLSMTILQERVPPAIRGRVFSTTSAVNALAFPVGILIYGWLLDTLGLDRTLILFVALNLAYPIWLCFVPALRRLDAPSVELDPG